MLRTKTERLKTLLNAFDSLAVTFSGGADSACLLAVAAAVFGGKKPLLAITLASPAHLPSELAFARAFARGLGVVHETITHDLPGEPAFAANTPDRCYTCKTILFQKVRELALARGIQHVVHGANAEDIGDFRPGLRAASRLGIRSPLAEAGLTKADIRRLSREMGLSTWDKPASGCLATRIPYGQPIDAGKLSMVAAAESVLRELGYGDCRVRHYGELASIEVPAADMASLMGHSCRIVQAFRDIGFLYVSADLEGFASGRLNRSLHVPA